MEGWAGTEEMWEDSDRCLLKRETEKGFIYTQTFRVTALSLHTHTHSITIWLILKLTNQTMQLLAGQFSFFLLRSTSHISPITIERGSIWSVWLSCYMQQHKVHASNVSHEDLQMLYANYKLRWLSGFSIKKCVLKSAWQIWQISAAHFLSLQQSRNNLLLLPFLSF